MEGLGIPKKNNRIFSILLFSLVLLALMTFGSTILGFGKGGFDIADVFRQYSFYYQFAVGSMLIILVVSALEYFVYKDDRRYGEGDGYYSPNESPHLRGKIFSHPIQILLLSAIFFSLLGLVGGVTSQTYFGVGSLGQQFTKLDGFLFNIFLVVPSENLGVAALLAIVLFSTRLYARKSSMSPESFRLFAWIFGILVFIIYGVTFHLLRYSNQDIALQQVMVVWALGGALTMISGTAIPFLVFHGANNGFYELAQSFSKDTTTIYLYTFIGIMVAAYFYFFVFRRKQ